MTELEYILSRTKTAYSRHRYGSKEWRKCAEFLLKEYGQDAAIGILCSKTMRWAADWNDGKPTVEGLKAYLEEDPLTKYDLSEFKEYEKKTRGEHMKVRVEFRQRRFAGKPVTKVIDLTVVPSYGMYFEYQEGWSLAQINDRLWVVVTANGVSIDGHGPQFADEDLAELATLGWEVPK